MTTLTLEELGSSFRSLDLNVPLPRSALADGLTRPLDLYRLHLAEILSGLVGCDPAAAYGSIQWPNNVYNGDLAIILPKLCPGDKSQELALRLVNKFPQDHPLFPVPFLEGVHFRIFIKPIALARLLLPYITDRNGTYGFDLNFGLRDPSSLESGSKKLVVELSSPNITTEFQGKHLRSTILGAFVSKFYKRMGWDVIKVNYLGDWGKPLALLAVGWAKFGSEEAFQADPVGHLLEVYHKIEEEFLPEEAARKRLRDEAVKEGRDEGEARVEIESQGLFAERNEYSKRMEEGDVEAVAFVERIRDVSIEDYTKFYTRLGINFDEYAGESRISQEAMAEVEQMLKDKDISEESGGTWMVDMKKHGARSGHAIIRDRSGSSTYLLRDLATVLERHRRYNFDKMIYVVANDNSVHFSQLFKILEALDMTELAGKLEHLHFNRTSHMGEKLGKGYKPQVILDQCENAMLEVLKTDAAKARLLDDSEEVAKVVGISALLAQELSTRTATAHAFDVQTMTAFKPGTGPDLQYWHARLCSILESHPAGTDLSNEDYESLAEEDVANLLRMLAQYPEVTHMTYKSLEPAAIVTYLASVVELLSECIGEDDTGEEISPATAALLEATRIVLANGMSLLGLTPVSASQADRVDTPVAA